MQYLHNLTEKEINALKKLSTQLGVTFETLVSIVTNEPLSLDNIPQLDSELKV